MKLKDNNTMIIITLIITTLLGPGIVWKLQQRDLDITKMKFEHDKLIMQKANTDLQLTLEKEKLEMQKSINNLQLTLEKDQLKLQKMNNLSKCMTNYLNFLMNKEFYINNIRHLQTIFKDKKSDLVWVRNLMK
jgi:hypothetical protein